MAHVRERTSGARALASVLALALVVTAVVVWPAAASTDPCAGAARAPFVDVPDTSAHADTVDCAYLWGLLRGIAPDELDASGSLRRDEAAAVLARAVRAAGTDLPPGDGRFADLVVNPFRADVEALAAAGIVAGRTADRFVPGASVTRAEMAALVVRAHDHVTGGGGSTAPAAPDAFDDDDGTVLEGEVDRAAALGLVRGRAPRTFVPTAAVRRDETASLVVRLLATLADAGHATTAPTGDVVRVEPVPTRTRAAMEGVTWRPGCPVGLDDLRLLTAPHLGTDGVERIGLMIVHADVARELAGLLGRLRAAEFPITRMRLVHRYGGSDAASMAADNTSGFNCRVVAGTSVFSQHAYGRAVDVNPVRNPYVAGDVVEPDAGRAWLDRGDVRPGMVVAGGPAEVAFDAIGWGWGGDWTSSKDYQHFSATGR